MSSIIPVIRIFLPPANEVCKGYVFTGVCLSTGGACVVAPGGGGGHVWLLLGGMHGFIQGVCMVLFGGHAWFYSGGACVVLFRGACVVLFRGVCMVLLGGCAWFYSGGAWFYLGGMHGFIWEGHALFYSGGMHGFIWGGVHGFFSFFGYNEIRSMSGQYASYWNAFLFLFCFLMFHVYNFLSC